MHLLPVWMNGLLSIAALAAMVDERVDEYAM